MDYANWCALSDDELARRDIAEVNLVAAVGLPGTESLDVPSLLHQLDEWAEIVARATQRAMQRRRPSDEYQDLSPNQFRMLVLTSVLSGHLGVKYDLDAMVGDFDGSDSRRLFIHGLLTGHGGTCVSMPVLYAAIGRRLGYPIKLVLVPNHMLCRWSGDSETFNIEATSPGLNCPPDEHYLTWPKPISPEKQAATRWWLRDLSPREELAYFLAHRGFCWLEYLQTGLAVEAFYYAVRLEPPPPLSYEDWCLASILHHALVEARARPREMSGVTIVRLPEPKHDWERHLRPRAEAELQRLLMNQGKRLAREREPESWLANARRFADYDQHIGHVLRSNSCTTRE
jgi:regulator of sirC expression with transglutaminase-like and TPR domain